MSQGTPTRVNIYGTEIFDGGEHFFLRLWGGSVKIRDEQRSSAAKPSHKYELNKTKRTGSC